MEEVGEREPRRKIVVERTRRERERKRGSGTQEAMKSSACDVIHDLGTWKNFAICPDIDT